MMSNRVLTVPFPVRLILLFASLASGQAGTPSPVSEELSLPDDLVEVADAQYAPLAGLAWGSAEAQARQAQAVEDLGLPLEVRTRQTGIALRLVPAGSFTMGSPPSEGGRDSDETQRQVTVSQAFYCGKYEVTQGQWQQVMGSNPSCFPGAGQDAPVEQATWNGCQAFVTMLCQMEGVPEGTYRLLTEAEWEYACRAGTVGAFCCGDSDSGLGQWAWSVSNSGGTTHPVGQKAANAFGLYDMHGNVWEWCEDRYGAYGSAVVDPFGGASRVHRGGGWSGFARRCRSANRESSSPGVCFTSLGLRLARATPPPPGSQPLPADLMEVADAQYAPLTGLASGSEEAQTRQAQAVESLGLPLEVKTRQTGIVLRLVPAGSFTMGSPLSESGRYSNETQHQVTLSRPFYCAKYEVTQRQWQQVMTTNPSWFRTAGQDAPVEQVSWDNCQAFLTRVCEMEGVPEGTYRLLTEAEWEYACRAGTQTPLYNGSLTNITGEDVTLDRIAWYDRNSGDTTHAVGQKLCNAWGLYDMHGNVWEWCADWYGDYGSGVVVDPLGPRGDYRVSRGGGWHNIASECRSAIRSAGIPSSRGYAGGLRLARATPPTPGSQPLPPDLVEVADAQYAPLTGLASASEEAQARQAQAVEDLGLPLEVRTRQTGIALCLVPTGSFTMGSPSSEGGRDSDETQHQVTLTRAFYCGKYEVTQGQWRQVMGSNPSFFGGAGADAPVEEVSWEDCQAFLTMLCDMEYVPRGTYRLLTEAEWEYACRAGAVGAYCFGDNDSSLGQWAWYGSNSSSTTHPVGQKAANAFGLYDMHGNVWEWCADWYGDYGSGVVVDPLGPRSGDLRVLRGGRWSGSAGLCRSANRGGGTPGYRRDYLGLRLARTTPSYP
ncbi:MAG: formylglycine-generating enzyme family protein [Sedimentisphaerales bacterium]|nr:formylglycine-generating enzyme family protein [Sedimentisphaerales bacterium]